MKLTHAADGVVWLHLELAECDDTGGASARLTPAQAVHVATAIIDQAGPLIVPAKNLTFLQRELNLLLAVADGKTIDDIVRAENDINAADEIEDSTQPEEEGAVTP